jgi:hypothetical protein
MLKKPCTVLNGDALYHTLVEKHVLEAILIDVVIIYLDFCNAFACLCVRHNCQNAIQAE